MCVVKAYKSKSCPHRWMTITKFCGPGMGFTNTIYHEFRPDSTKFFSGAPSFEVAAANTCPICDKKGQYDGNVTRMVMKKGNASGCRITCGVGTPAPTGVETHAYARQSYSHAPGGSYGYGMPVVAQSGIMPGQILSPLQQQIEANRVAQEMKKRQFYPNRELQESKCFVM